MKVRLKPLHHLVADHPQDHRIILEPGITVLGRGEDTKCGCCSWQCDGLNNSAEAGDCDCQLLPALTAVGRCKVALCSRKQVRIVVDEHQATVVGLTKRPCIVRRDDGSTAQSAKGELRESASSTPATPHNSTAQHQLTLAQSNTSIAQPHPHTIAFLGDAPLVLRHHDTLILLAGCDLDASFQVELIQL